MKVQTPAHQENFQNILQQVVIADKATTCIEVRQFNAWFNRVQVLKNINLKFQQHRINCIIGPSGSGKSTLIRSINRINDDIDSFHHQGNINFNDVSIYAKKDVTQIRTQIGMVFQKPCVFPKSIAENILFGVQFCKKLSPRQRQALVVEKLQAVALWQEVKQRLHEPATNLSIGQQQRLCIARSLAINPQVLLLDEPTSSLDPVSSRAIEDLMLQLKYRFTVIFVTHNILQARRIAEHLIFMCEGQVIEQGDKDRLCKNPEKQQTWDYLNNEYCDCDNNI